MTQASEIAPGKERLTQQEQAADLGISSAWLRELTLKRKISRELDGTYHRETARKQYAAYKAESAPQGSEGEPGGRGGSVRRDLEAAKAKKEAALARRAEVELDRMLGRLVYAEHHERVVAVIADAMRGWLQSVPGRWAARLPGDRRKISAALRELAAESVADLDAAVVRALEAPVEQDGPAKAVKPKVAKRKTGAKKRRKAASA